ncbi:hypothetical protein ASD76_16175 [Altererythrobacter sp. Root672]|nr:hypothetical protein ASD76_16175 [Altererythrobacter sp. Root672]
MVEADSVEAADQAISVPAFDRVRVARDVERAIAGGDALADPALGVSFARGGTGFDHAFEVVIAGNAEAILPDDFGERPRATKFLKRDDRPVARLHPVDILVVPAVSHREDAAAIGHQQQVFGNYLGCGSVHGNFRKMGLTSSLAKPVRRL